ncbi:MAG: alkylmercury lyase family protein [Gammaproteobacteria bacterium]|nr:alkylmercury lyase family protein [Gammaproteobacteria bacterium]
MSSTPAPNRPEARQAALDGLARLRAAFPLETRIETAGQSHVREYTRVLTEWLRARVPPINFISTESSAALIALDAIVADELGLGCYPFSARPTGIVVTLPAGPVHAMCAVDALAIARLAESAITIDAPCAVCANPLHLRVEANGGLEHDQVERARVIWKAACHAPGSCSSNLCRSLLLLCPACEAPAGSTVYTLPQATMIGNSFFGFQRRLIAGLSE